MKTVIIHDNDNDGLCAAWAVLQANPEATCVPMCRDTLPPAHVIKDAHVFLLDFCYKTELLSELLEIADSVRIIDHHKTTLATYSALSDQDGGRCRLTYSDNASSCMLAWNAYNSTRAPLLLRYVQDRDLYRWELPDSRDYNAGIGKLTSIDDVERAMSRSKNEVIAAGKIINAERQTRIDAALESARDVKIAGLAVKLTSCNYDVISDVGAELAKNRAFGATYSERDGKRFFSLRSAENGMDVSQVAAKFGGGGNKHAAGFSVSLDHELASI